MPTLKVKLLKKLRRRFLWFREYNKDCWTIYDRYTSKFYYCFQLGMVYTNDMCIYKMLDLMNRTDIYMGFRKRTDIRRAKREKEILQKLSDLEIRARNLKLTTTNQ